MATSLEKWRSAMQPPAVVAFFDGLFETGGVRVSDTGEAFTCRHLGDRIEFADGLDEGAVDFTVEIESSQVDRLLVDAQAGAFDAGAQYRIMVELATAATRSMLARPVVKSRLLRRVLFTIGRAESLMHVTLVPPPGEPEVGHTIVYVDGQSLVIEGLHGRVPHVYRLSVADASEFQKRMLAARKANKLSPWLAFARWYGGLRKKVAKPIGRGSQEG